jgi:hypothetical protein
MYIKIEQSDLNKLIAEYMVSRVASSLKKAVGDWKLSGCMLPMDIENKIKYEIPANLSSMSLSQAQKAILFKSDETILSFVKNVVGIVENNVDMNKKNNYINMGLNLSIPHPSALEKIRKNGLCAIYLNDAFKFVTYAFSLSSLV